MHKKGDDDMKKTIRICFAIVCTCSCIWAMFLLMGSANGEFVFYALGGICISLICLTLISFWVGCLIVFIAIIKETIQAGKGLNYLITHLIDKKLEIRS